MSEISLTKQILGHLQQNLGIWASGEDLGAQLGVTRPAIWKAIQALRLEGYPLEASRNGYRLEPDIPMLQGVIYKTKVGSTMDEIRNLARAGAAEFTVLLAEQQTTGRGRRGKPWQGASASGLYFTILLRPNIALSNLGLLPLLIGACVAKSIELETSIVTQLKWSNDILNDKKQKFAGILLESELEDGVPRFALVGIGINIRRQDFPPEFSAAALEEYVPVHRRNLLQKILSTIQYEYQQFLEQPSHAITLWKKQNNILGQSIQILEPNGTNYIGIAQDLDPSGALIVQTDNGSRTIYAAEVSVRV